jgi:hypothetical protein
MKLVKLLGLASAMTVALVFAAEGGWAGPGGSDKQASNGLGRAAVTTTCDNLNKRKLRTVTPVTNVGTTSGNYVAIANAAQSITTTVTSCIVVTFSARAQAPDAGPGSNEAMFIRPRLDGTVTGKPADGEDMAFTANDPPGWYDMHAFTWVFPAVPPGKHVVAMEFSSSNGVAVQIFQHTLDVQYR